MHRTRSLHGRHAILGVAAILLVATNLRGVITGLGPVLDQVGADTGTGAAGLGLLGAIPLLAFGIVSPLAHSLGQRIGLERAVLAALLGITAGTVLRSAVGPEANLWAGTALLGAGIAVANVLLPAVVKRDFPGHVPALTAGYSSVMAATASRSSAAPAASPLPAARPRKDRGAPAGARHRARTGRRPRHPASSPLR